MSGPWWTHAACHGDPIELYFPSAGRAAAAAYERAQLICRSCPVRTECLADDIRPEYAGDRSGIRAGLGPRQRDEIARGHQPFPDFPPPITEGATLSVTDISPAAQPPAIPTDPDALIAWGAAQQSSRMQALADKARAALADLRQAAERESKKTQAEARINRLKAQLANAEADLRAAKRGGAQQGADRPSREELAAVRAWAREQGHQVSSHGLPKRELIEAYRAAHPAGQVA